MACQHFCDDYLGFCGASAFTYVPRISEMEQLCFKNFEDCSIYNAFRRTQSPVAGTTEENCRFCSGSAQGLES